MQMCSWQAVSTATKIITLFRRLMHREFSLITDQDATPVTNTNHQPLCEVIYIFMPVPFDTLKRMRCLSVKRGTGLYCHPNPNHGIAFSRIRRCHRRISWLNELTLNPKPESRFKMYMLDTNICIYIIKKRPISVLNRFDKISRNQICISGVTFAELFCFIEIKFV